MNLNLKVRVKSSVLQVFFIVQAIKSRPKAAVRYTPFCHRIVKLYGKHTGMIWAVWLTYPFPTNPAPANAGNLRTAS